jgi:hypothetical protein
MVQSFFALGAFDIYHEKKREVRDLMEIDTIFRGLYQTSARLDPSG